MEGRHIIMVIINNSKSITASSCAAGSCDNRTESALRGLIGLHAHYGWSSTVVFA